MKRNETNDKDDNRPGNAVEKCDCGLEQTHRLCPYDILHWLRATLSISLSWIANWRSFYVITPFIYTITMRIEHIWSA
jgi:hypothetical protein